MAFSIYHASSGIAWTNIHPNVITDSEEAMFRDKGNSFEIETWGDVPQGYVCAKDIGEVIATVLRKGPEKHAGKNYYLSIDVLTATQLGRIFEEVIKKPVKLTFTSIANM